MSDIFTEVDEDLRRERALKLWKQYGNYVIGAAVVIVAGTAGYVAWEDYSRKQSETAAAQYVAALDEAKSGQGAEATKSLESIGRGGSGYSVLARLEEAGLKINANDIAGAADIYRRIVADSGVDPEIRDAAGVLAGLDAVDSANPDAVNKEVAPLAGPVTPWRYLAWEVQALAALKAGKLDEARKLYAQISDDPQAPAGLRARAAETLAAMAAG